MKCPGHRDFASDFPAKRVRIDTVHDTSPAKKSSIRGNPHPSKSKFPPHSSRTTRTTLNRDGIHGYPCHDIKTPAILNRSIQSYQSRCLEAWIKLSPFAAQLEPTVRIRVISVPIQLSSIVEDAWCLHDHYCDRKIGELPGIARTDLLLPSHHSVDCQYSRDYPLGPFTDVVEFGVWGNTNHRTRLV